MNLLQCICKMTIIFTMVALFLQACTKNNYDSVAISGDPQIVECIGVLPTKVAYGEKTQGNEGAILSDGAEFMDIIVLKELRKSDVQKVVDIKQLQFNFAEIGVGTKDRLHLMSKKAQCNYLLEPTLLQFRQRQGGDFAVDSPASAAFELKIIDSENGNSLWITTFRETQTSLLSNLFAFPKAMKRGFKWITVEDLLHQGVEEKVAECPFVNRID